MATHARPLDPDDLEGLEPIDRAYAERFGLEPALTRGSAVFFARAGHAFAAYRDGRPAGFALAQAVWDGTRPTLLLGRLAVRDDDDREAREALLESVTKSAYDAAVYDLAVDLPKADAVGAAALETKSYREAPLRRFVRILGSRGVGR